MTRAKPRIGGSPQDTRSELSERDHRKRLRNTVLGLKEILMGSDFDNLRKHRGKVFTRGDALGWLGGIQRLP